MKKPQNVPIMQTNKFNLWLKKCLGENLKKCIILFLFPQRNQFLLFNYTNRAKKNKVNLNYWCESDNLGDTLAPVIVNYMLSLKNISPDKPVSKRKHLYAVGSVLTAGIQDCTVWGSGVLNSVITYRLKNRKLDIRAVRGPFTQAVLQDYGYKCPSIYGDPAIFLPCIYKPEYTKKKYKYGLVMHMDQMQEVSVNNILNIDICTSDFRDFVNKLNSVEIVISSSLHGIILAESYGIKAVLLKPTKDYLKNYDWYYSTRRYSFPIAENIEEALNIKPAALPELNPLRRKLLETFPYDLYE